MHLRVLLLLLTLSFSWPALAEGWYQSVAELRLIRGVKVYLSDQVTDGCLSNPGALRVEAELILRRSGIGVSDAGTYHLIVTPIGWEMKSTSGQPIGKCAARLDLELLRFAHVPEGHSAIVIAYKDVALLTGYDKLEMQEALRSRVSEIVSDLANEILRAQGK